MLINTKSNSLVKSGDVYPLFKLWFSSEQLSTPIEELLTKLYDCARYYVAFSLVKEKDPELHQAFADLRELVEVATPTIVKLYELYDKEHLSKSDFISASRLLESYILRRSVCDMQTRSLGNIFASLAQKITKEAPLESLMVSIARFTRKSRFPSDAEFFESLNHKDMYESRICSYVLNKLENDSKEKIDTSKFTIEHIMPQNSNLRPEWQAMLGENWKPIQEVWLHRLGNLTLTGYNSEYSDKGFIIKKELEGGFNDSPLRLNRDVRNASVWTEVEMEARGEVLASQAVKLWAPLKVSSELVAIYELQEKKRQSVSFTLDDIQALNGNVRSLFLSLDKVVRGAFKILCQVDLNIQHAI